MSDVLHLRNKCNKGNCIGTYIRYAKQLIKIFSSTIFLQVLFVVFKCGKANNNQFTFKILRNRNLPQEVLSHYTALLWQKEASDIPCRSELLMFSYFT